MLTSSHLPCTYFGDGVWDKMASAEPGYDFVLVSHAAEHARRIDDFSDTESVPETVGLPVARKWSCRPYTNGGTKEWR